MIFIKRFVFILTLIASTFVFAADPTTGIQLSNPLIPIGAFSSHVSNYGYGGWHSTTNLSVIPSYLVDEGTAAFNTTEGKLYIYLNGAWSVYYDYMLGIHTNNSVIHVTAQDKTNWNNVVGLMSTNIVIWNKIIDVVNPTPEIYFKYSLNVNNEATITNYSGPSTVVNIPSTLDGYTVRTLSNLAFQFNTAITSVTVPDTVTTIAGNCFRNCSALTYLKIGSGITSIPSGLTSGCNALTTTIIGNGVTTIAFGAFGGEPHGSITFGGNCPAYAGPNLPMYYGTVYRYDNTTGWGSTFAAMPVVTLGGNPYASPVYSYVKTDPFNLPWTSLASISFVNSSFTEHIALANPHIQYPLITSLGSIAYQNSNNVNVVTANVSMINFPNSTLTNRVDGLGVNTNLYVEDLYFPNLYGSWTYDIGNPNYVPSNRTVTVNGIVGELSSNLFFEVVSTGGSLSSNDQLTISSMALPYQEFSTNISAVASTCTITYACGNLIQIIATSSPTVISVDNIDFPTNGVSRFGIELYSGTNSVIFDPNMISSSSIFLSTNEWNSIYFRRSMANPWTIRN